MRRLIKVAAPPVSSLSTIEEGALILKDGASSKGRLSMEHEEGGMAGATIAGKDSRKTLTKLTYLSAISFLANYGVTLLVGFFINPILLTLLGSSLFGTWKICQRLLTYISGVDGQATQALQWTIANKQSSHEVGPKKRDVGCAIIIWLRFLPLVLVVGSLVAWFSPYLIRQLPPEHFTATRIACAVLVLNLILLPLNSIPQAVMLGMNLAYRCTWIRSCGIILGGLFMVAAAYLGWGLVGLAASVLCATIFTGFFVLIAAKRSLPWLGVDRPQKDEIRSFFGFSIWVLASSLVSKFMLSCDIIILGLVSSAAMVTSFVLSTYTVQMAMSLILMLVSASLPGLGGIFGRKDYEKATKVRGEIMTLSWLFVVAFGSMILLWNYSFVKLWVGPENFIGATENLLMVLLMTQLIFIRNDARIVDITLNIRKKVLLGLFSAVIAVLLAYVFSRYWLSNVAGLVVGLMVGRMILTIAYPMLVEKAFKARATFSGIGFVRPFLVMTGLYVGTSLAGTHLNVESWIRLILYGTGSFIVILAIAFFLGLKWPQRRQVFLRMAHLGIPGFRNN